MNTYRFELVGGATHAPGTQFFCESNRAALGLAQTMAEAGAPVEVWLGADSLGIVFSKEAGALPNELVHPDMTRGQTLLSMEVGD